MLRGNPDGETGSAVAAGREHAAVVAVLILHIAVQSGDFFVQGCHQRVQVFGFRGHIHGDDPLPPLRQHSGFPGTAARQGAGVRRLRCGEVHLLRHLGGRSVIIRGGGR